MTKDRKAKLHCTGEPKLLSAIEGQSKEMQKAVFCLALDEF